MLLANIFLFNQLKEVPYAKLNILIVGDNPGDFIRIEEYIRSKAAHVAIHSALNFIEAKKRLTQKHKLDVILLDLSLPDAGGESLIIAMIGLAAETPIIILTENTDEAFSIKMLSLGIADCLLKAELNPLHLHKRIYYSIERKRYQAELKESARFYHSTFSASPIPMFLVEPATFQIIEVNQAVITNYGYTRAEIEARSILEIYPKADKKETENYIKILN